MSEPRAGATSVAQQGAPDAAELILARRVATWAPVVTLAAASVVGATVAVGPALLVLAGGALFGTIAFFWASIRTLGGEAPLAEGFDLVAARQVQSPAGAAERKRTVLRALKDIELEHSIGKIDDNDYAELISRYREEAKAILREMDQDVGPLRDRAEQVARKYLAKRGIVLEVARVADGSSATPAASPSEDGDDGAAADGAPQVGRRQAPSRRVECPSCETSNEVDALFCKKCGTRLAPTACQACDAVNEADAVFCKKCGRSLGGHAREDSDAPP